MGNERATRQGGPGHLHPEEAEALIEELRQQASQVEEQAAELEALNDELAAAEARLRGAIDSALDAFVTADAGSIVLDWNHHAETMFGWPASEAVGRNLAELIIPPQYREAHFRGMERFLATGEGPILNRRIEITALRRDGREFPVELTVAPSRWGSNVIFTAFLRDITERKRDEQRLATQYAITRVLAESTTVGEAAPRLLAAVCEGLGYEIGHFWSVQEGADVLRVADRWMAPALDAGEFEASTLTTEMARGTGLPGRVWQSGEPLWVRDLAEDTNFPRLKAAARSGLRSAFAFPVRIGGEFIGVMEFFARQVVEADEGLLAMMTAIGSDIGQFVKRKQAEERLREREELQRFFARVSTMLAAATPDYEATLRHLAHLAVPALADWCTIFTVDEGGSVQRVQIAHADRGREPVAQRLARYPVDPAHPHPVLEVVKTGSPLLLSEITPEMVRDAARDEEHRRLLEELGMRSAMFVPLTARGRTLGAITLVSAESGRCYDEEDLGVAHEFARRAALSLDNARLYAESSEANRVKTDFLATMSHELRTPLNAMIGYTDLLAEGIPERVSEPVMGYVRRIGLSARHLLQLIEEILVFSRLEASRETLVAETVELAELVSEVRAIIEPLAAGKGLRFAIRAPEKPVTLRTDPRKVRQILVNLLGNAVKFTEEGEIEFRAERRDGQVMFQVRDTGIGIAPEHLEKIFDPFWQVRQSTTRVASGTGLGLSVTRRLAALLGGRVEVESTPGEGSVFTVRLPIRARPVKAGDAGAKGEE
ncbi:MAG TPA: ATP-binding protein [Longimicrobiaceae bacterium]|nr:ATP-binding protein [Longimicrobiaceae bacterium]